MSYVNHFRAIILVSALGAACTKSTEPVVTESSEQVVLVSSKAYRSKGCWTHKDGSFRAFLVLGKDENYAIPEFISENCLITGGYANFGEAIILHIGTVVMQDSHGRLQSHFSRLKIGENTATDQPFPSGDSELYYLKAHVRQVAHPYRQVYDISNIDTIADVHMTFGKLLTLTREERETLLQSIED